VDGVVELGISVDGVVELGISVEIFVYLLSNHESLYLTRPQRNPIQQPAHVHDDIL